MFYVLALLLAYGLCYGALQKVGPWLEAHPGLPGPLGTLFSCPYCMGFHCGWMSWLMMWGCTGEQLLAGAGVVGVPWLPVLCWSLVCAGSCYILEMAAVALEKAGR